MDIKPEILEKIREKFKSQLGENLSDKEILEKCLEFSNKYMDELFLEFLNSDLINKKKKSYYNLINGILEEKYNQIKSSGKFIKEVIRESWRF